MQRAKSTDQAGRGGRQLVGTQAHQSGAQFPNRVYSGWELQPSWVKRAKSNRKSGLLLSLSATVRQANVSESCAPLSCSFPFVVSPSVCFIVSREPRGCHMPPVVLPPAPWPVYAIGVDRDDQRIWIAIPALLWQFLVTSDKKEKKTVRNMWPANFVAGLIGLVLIVALPPRCSDAFNVETKHYAVYRNESSSMFGFSVSVYRDRNGRGWWV